MTNSTSKNSQRVFNFNPGPAMLPEEVLEEVRANLLNYQNSGIGVMELSHRGRHFEEIIQQAESRLRELLSIGDEYAVLFTTGGATTQFSMIPMNLAGKDQQANYILSGVWAEGAYEEAKKFAAVHIAASSKEDGYRSLPRTVQLSANPAYLHYTSNNTAYGSQFANEPEAAGAPLICDASSDLLHRHIDINKYAMIYAGAQKNLGAAGVTLVIIKKELLDRAPAGLPLLMDYRTYAKSQSLYNTPPTFPIYVTSLVFDWIKRIGGLAEMEKRNREKASVIYHVVDELDFYEGVIEPESRSLMNITFRLRTPELTDRFLSESESAGLHGLKGHRLIGGFRVSMYNALPVLGAYRLAEFMREFEKANV